MLQGVMPKSDHRLRDRRPEAPANEGRIEKYDRIIQCRPHDPFADDLGRPWKDREPRLARKATIDFSAVHSRLQPLCAPAKHEKRGLRLTEMPMHAAVVF